MQKFGPYFTDKYKTPWGSAINFDDAGSDAVRKYYIENILMWFRDFHVDAIRLDAVHAIRDFGPTHILAEVRSYTDKLMAVTGKSHYLIAECDLNDVKFIRPLNDAGYGMDAQWIDEFHHALRVASGQERSGYYSDFNGVEHLAKSFRSAYVYDGIYSPHRERTFGSSSEGMPGESFVVFSQNHDQVGNRMLGERTSTLLTFEQLKLMATSVLVSPFVPLLFMGEEYGETNPFLYFTSHEGKELIEAVRNGRKKEFEHFFTGNDFPDPQSQEVYEQSRLSWDRLDRFSHKMLFNFYKDLIRIRKTAPALRFLDPSMIEVDVIDGNGIRIVRHHEEGDVMCLLNFSQKSLSFPVTQGEVLWDPQIYSAEVKWGGTANPVDVANGTFDIEKHAAAILTSRRV
jgi:maltooligosyltrehalose trehalohydrolase